MPSGKTHDKINFVILILIFISLLKNEIMVMLPFIDYSVVITQVDIIVFTFMYVVGTLYLSPDLDIHSYPFQRWKILRYIWVPYQTIFSHRDVLHHPVFGPLLILSTLYLLCLPLLILGEIDVIHDIPFDWMLYGGIGYVVSFELHILSDVVGSKLKRL